MSWRESDAVERVVLVVYVTVGLTILACGIVFLIQGQRLGWTMWALLLWNFAYLAFGPLYRRWKAKRHAAKS